MGGAFVVLGRLAPPASWTLGKFEGGGGVRRSWASAPPASWTLGNFEGGGGAFVVLDDGWHHRSRVPHKGGRLRYVLYNMCVKKHIRRRKRNGGQTAQAATTPKGH